MRLRGMGITRKPSTRRRKGAAHVLQSAAAGRYDSYEQMLRDVAANQSDYDKEQVSFFFLSDIDLNLREPYDIIVLKYVK